MSVIVADKRQVTDGSAANLLLQISSPLPMVLVSRPDGFVFNEELNGVRDYVLVDFCEYGWDAVLETTHLFGQNTYNLKKYFPSDEWDKFETWVRKNPPKLYFKRELLKGQVSEDVLPIEYPCLFQVPDAQTKEQYEARPIDVFFNWGYSSEHRRRVHGEIWKYAQDYGYMVCDNLYYLNGFLEHELNPKKWVTVNTPHYHRHPMQDILGINSLAKISLSHFGAGMKCFRSSESPINSLMAMPKNDLAWTFDWNETNCLQVPIGVEVPHINAALQKGELYERYVNGVENCKNYFLPKYINHLEKTIRERV